MLALYCVLTITLKLVKISHATHKILQELRDTPAIPEPSLRSQFSDAAKDYRGRIIIRTGTQFCPNTLANYDPRQDQEDINEAVRSIFQGLPPNNSISIITAVGQITGTAFIQGVPMILYDRDVHRRWLGILSVVVIHPSTAVVLRHYRHPSHIGSAPLRAFLETLQPGRIILIAGYARYMPEDLKTYLTHIGMKVSDIHLPAIVKNITFPPMLMITWAGKWGGKSIGGVSRVWRPSVKQGLFQEIHVLKIEEIWCKNVLSAKDSPTPQLEAQKNLCEKYDGYGAFCSCPLLPLANKELKESKGLVMTNTVVVIMASRPTSLHRLLVSLTESSVIAKENILVFTNQPSAPELTLVCQSHGIYTEWTGRASDCEGLHNSRLYEAGLMASLILRPKGMFFLVLEDDMEIEPDIFAWLTQARQILLYNDNYICVNTLATSNKGNDNDNSHNNTITYNGDKFQPGFFVERPILEAMLRFWPLATHDLSWENILDYWAGDEPCLVPPRSFVRHAVSSYYTLGGDLSPVMPSESKNMDHMIRPFSLKVG